MIRVVIAGFMGKLGRAAWTAVDNHPDMELVAGVDLFADKGTFDFPTFTSKEDFNIEADVWVDVTAAGHGFENAKFALERGLAPVIGTTGFSTEEIEELRRLAESKGLGGLIAPNFAVGAILMMRFAAEAAKYLGDVEVIELHHDGKKDAPSGTAVKTLQMMAENREPHAQGLPGEIEEIAGSRGGDFDGMRVHSVRLPGLVAHQEVLFGGVGEGLSIRHDSYDRASFAHGITLGINKVIETKQFVYGLENFM
ncbi:MAG: 4-hydroxy-tetrahydrodipicolinate reductase [Lactobacillales bacterium]|jgi:4-hydroxy-tetrahydrodipicolinate reductase|nr:4-hydroxy-tetrahydrodipicolinate reductase [Lactobacillales bacterium]